MTFDEISGNEKIFEELKNAARCGQISHAYILEGAIDIHKEMIAKAFAKSILCKEHRGSGCNSCVICNKIEHGNHEDVFFLEKEENSIKDEDVVRLQDRLRNKPLGERNIAILKDADTMTLRAQNRLLKTLEEPPDGTVIMLLSENTESLIKTIVSRCIVVRLPSTESLEDDALRLLAETTAEALLAGRPFYELKKTLAAVLSDKKQALAFLDALEVFYGRKAVGNNETDRLYPKAYLYEQVGAIEETRRSLRGNGTVGYALKRFLLKSME